MTFGMTLMSEDYFETKKAIHADSSRTVVALAGRKARKRLPPIP
jgi:hypothetical protein